MNKNELISLRNNWLQQASRDLSSRLIDFMEVNRLNEAQLADILALDVNQIRNMLNGAQNVTLLEFATLLIATGNVLRIEPISASPFAQQHGMPSNPRLAANPRSRSVGRKQPQRDANGRFMPRDARGGVPSGAYPMPPMGGMPMPPMGGMPMGNLSEQFGGMPGVAPVAPQTEETRVNDEQWDDLGKNELSNIIRQNHWDGEIDLNRANRSQMIAFLESKTSATQTMVEENTQTLAPSDEGSISQMAQAIAAQLASNPQMVQQIMASMQPQR